MLARRIVLSAFLAMSASVLIFASTSRAQDAKKPAEPATAKAPAATEAPAAETAKANSNDAKNDVTLTAKQDAIALRFKRFEKTLLQMARYMGKTDPEQADLLIRAITHSQEGRINDQLQRIVALLDQQQIGDALDRQAQLVSSLQSLLDLLQSEDRRNEIEREKQRLKDLLKDLNKIIGKERDVRAATERGENPERLAGKQDKIAKKTGDLVKKIDGQDAEKKGDGKSSEGKPSDGKPSDGKPSDGKPKDGKPEDGKPKDGKPEDGKPKDGKPEDGKPKDGKPSEGKPSEGKPSEGKPSEGKPSEGKPSEGKPSEGKPSEGKPSEGKQKDDKTPGRDDIEQARKEMEKAIEELKKLDHDKASGHQDEALQKLAEAKAKLEEILRQLREEEQKLLLAALEARFKKMLAMQLVIRHETIRLDKVQEAARSGIASRAQELSHDEDLIAIDAAKALTLLQEEGSSVAFPEAVREIRDDVITIRQRLLDAKVGELTQAIEFDVIEALGELIEALQKEMEKMEEKEQDEQEPKEGKPQDPPLVDQLAELKMLRALQFRVLRRTKRLGRLIDGEQATEAEVLTQLQQLARRQSRIQAATYNLVTGKNK